MSLRDRLFLYLEFLLLFGGMPLVILALRQSWLMFAVLWGAALAIAAILRRRQDFDHRLDWNRAALAKGFPSIFRRFCILAPILVVFTYIWTPQTFFKLPLERPGIWVTIFLLYPLLSVWPQELIYRSFLRHRYASLFTGLGGFIAASTLAFGYMHIVFTNATAVALTTIGGYLFASTYQRHRSLALVCVEHSLYGWLIFTIGLGHYFYNDAPWL